jgi:small-conductance mechanosensitive channel
VLHTRIADVVAAMGPAPWAKRLIADERNLVTLIAAPPGGGNRPHWHADFDEWWVVFAGRLAPVGDPLPSFFARAACATWVAALRAAPAIAATLALYLGLCSWGCSYRSAYAEAITVAVVIAAAVSGLAVAILTPRYPHWRLVNLSDRSAAQLVRLTRGIAIAFAFDLVLREMIRLMFLPLPVSVAQTLITASCSASASSPRFEPAGLVTAEPVSRYRPRWLKLPLLIISIAILTSSALGYVALGSYVTSQVLLTGSCLVAVTLLHIAIKALAAEPEDNTRPMGRMLESQLGLDRDRRRQVSRGLDWSLDLGLVALAIPAILLSLGFGILNHAKALVLASGRPLPVRRRIRRLACSRRSLNPLAAALVAV